jgi:hypothetical protein
VWALANSARAFLRPGAVRGCARKSVPENRRAQFGTCSPSHANSEAELPRELAPPIRAWIRGYVGSESELILRHLYDRISMSFTTQGSSQPGEASPSFTPRPEFHCAPAESGHRESSCVAGSCRVAIRSFAPSFLIVNDELYCGGM